MSYRGLRLLTSVLDHDISSYLVSIMYMVLEGHRGGSWQAGTTLVYRQFLQLIGDASQPANPSAYTTVFWGVCPCVVG